MTHPVPWLIAALWAFAALLWSVDDGSLLAIGTAAIGVSVCLVLAAQGWWAEFRAYQPEGRHR